MQILSIRPNAGFTLIELSIVLVVIGLIVGGVLVGQDLIKAAEVRSQISQIEKFNTAANTFKLKYGGLPGDIPEPHASGFGFVARGSNRGEGDGNGKIEGACDVSLCSTPIESYFGAVQGWGETAVFFRDLGASGLVAGNFNYASSDQSYTPSSVTENSSPNLSNFMAKAKIGGSNYLYVWSGGYGAYAGKTANTTNYFAVSGVIDLGGNSIVTRAGISVIDAYNIDKKIDDGLPQSGNVMAIYVYDWYSYWASGSGQGAFLASNHGPTTTATSASSTTCYDNSGGTGTQQYSVGQNGGTGINCALSFKFQ